VNLRQRYKIIRDLYLADQNPWIVAFSGGKDSTAALQLVWHALSTLPGARRRKAVHVCYVDTGMEHPAFEEHLADVLRDIQSAADAQFMPFRTRILHPELKHRFFVAVIGRGYAPPTHWFRWCTKGMRIRPMSTFIKGQLSASGEVVIVLGLRRGESHSRAEVLKKFAEGRPFVGRYGNLRGAVALTPIEDFDLADIWQFLMQLSCPWGNDNRRLMQLYSLAAGGECPSYSLGDGIGPTCGGSRFGCWTCTVVRKDKSGQAIADEEPRFDGLVAYRNWLAEMRYDPSRRWKVRRNGRPGPGPLTIATRREALSRLLEVETSVGRQLVKPEEIEMIQAHWTADGDRKNTAIAMYRAARCHGLTNITCSRSGQGLS
jgi:DNA sulfur modification protein DndC